MPSSRTAGNAINRKTCAICQKSMDEKYIHRHVKGHRKLFRCTHCGQRFARADSVPSHVNRQHGVNASSFICYMKGCNRGGLGLQTEIGLIQHLDHSHQGATVADNQQAAAEKGIALPREGSSDEGSDDENTSPTHNSAMSKADEHPDHSHQGATVADNQQAASEKSVELPREGSSDESASPAHNSIMGEADEHSAEESEEHEITDDTNVRQTLTPEQYETIIYDLKNQLVEQQEAHAMKLEAIRKFHEAQIQDIAKGLNHRA